MSLGGVTEVDICRIGREGLAVAGLPVAAFPNAALPEAMFPDAALPVEAVPEAPLEFGCAPSEKFSMRMRAS
jgi:hypothetical protein